MGWDLDRPRYLVLRYWRELRVSALVLSWSSQYSMTAAFTLDLTICLEGLLSSQSSGCGRQYWRQSWRILQNQDLVLAEAAEMMLLALAVKGLFGSVEPEP